MINELWSCGSCGKSSLPNEGKIFKDNEYQTSFICGVCLNKIMQYKIEITFTANQKLTNGELADLESAITLQLEEPTDYDQNDVLYQISQINYKIERI